MRKAKVQAVTASEVPGRGKYFFTTKGGQIYGETDEIRWSIVKDPVHVNDFHATMLHQFGFDHLKLTHRFQGRDFRLTDVAGNVVKPWLA